MSLPNIQEAIATIRTLPEALNVIEQLMSINHQLIQRIEVLEREVARLKGQPKKPTYASSSSQSSASLRTQLQEKTHHKSVKDIPIDHTETLSEVDRCTCGCADFISVRTWEKTVQGIIIRRDNVRYRGRDKTCRGCGTLWRSALPAGTAGHQFSPELKSWISIFKYDCRLSEGLIHRLLSGMGVAISRGHINELIGDNAQKLECSYTHLKVWGIKLSAYFHTDATGHLRQIVGRGGKMVTEHLQIVCHRFLSLFRITRRYNAKTVGDTVIGKRGSGAICISDDGSPNGTLLRIAKKQLCWIHELRHYAKLLPVVKNHQRETTSVLMQFWQWYWRAKDYGRDPTEEKRRWLEKQFDRIVEMKTAYAELYNRLRLTARKKDRLLLFLEYPGIPIENNQAERDLRFAVILRKLTGGTRSPGGNKSLQRHLSVLQTIRKQGLPLFETFHGLLMGTVDPFVLTAKTLPAIRHFPR